MIINIDSKLGEKELNILKRNIYSDYENYFFHPTKDVNSFSDEGERAGWKWKSFDRTIAFSGNESSRYVVGKKTYYAFRKKPLPGHIYSQIEVKPTA